MARPSSRVKSLVTVGPADTCLIKFLSAMGAFFGASFSFSFEVTAVVFRCCAITPFCAGFVLGGFGDLDFCSAAFVDAFGVVPAIP